MRGLEAAGWRSAWAWAADVLVLAAAAVLMLAAAAVLVLAAAACGGDGGTGPNDSTGTPNQRPVASFTVSVSEGAAPLEVRFDGSASADPDGSIASWAWTFGDGATGSGSATTHVYQEAGSYTPSLTVTDERGATHTQQGSTITVNSPPGTGENEIAGVVWHDADADGERDEDEETVPGFVVFLDENGDGARDSTEAAAVTNDDGEYRFDGLDGRQSYTVTQEMTLGWSNTAPGVEGLPSLPRALPIIGGEAAEAGAFPFQVAVTTNRSFCGGTFIAGDWVLTAAHCVDGGVNPDSARVRAGTLDLREGGEFIKVARILIHPAFGTAGINNDIALLQLDSYHRYPRIELLTPDRAVLAEPGTMATTVGWGLTSEGGNPSPTLKKLEAQIISNDECKTHLDSSVLETTICAGMQGSSESTCSGDSGGPLMVPFRGRWVQVGIVSFGTTICYQPTAYARVSALVGYVLENIPPEPSGTVVVDWSDGGTVAEVNFGNFR